MRLVKSCVQCAQLNVGSTLNFDTDDDDDDDDEDAAAEVKSYLGNSLTTTSTPNCQKVPTKPTNDSAFGKSSLKGTTTTHPHPPRQSNGLVFFFFLKKEPIPVLIFSIDETSSVRYSLFLVCPVLVKRK